MWKRIRTMNRIRFIIMLFLCQFVYVNCGRNEEDVEYYNIVSEVETLFAPDHSGEFKGVLLGMQYYQGEPVQLWSEGDKVYLVSTDGTRKKLMEIPRAAAMRCYMDRDGNVYCFFRLEGNAVPSIWMYDASGHEEECIGLGEGTEVADICQLSDGGILMLVRDRGTGTLSVAEFDAEKSTVTILEQVQLGLWTSAGYIGEGREGMLFLEQGYTEGISEISLKEGSLGVCQSFQGSAYKVGMNTKGMALEDFRMSEDGGVEILWADSGSGHGVLERLVMAETDKTILLLQGVMPADPDWIKEKVAQFNKISETYQVVFEYPPLTEHVEYGQMLRMQIAAGKGPDILMADLARYAEKEWLVDLAPYMKKSGMKEEDYFSSAFSQHREGKKIYTAALSGTIVYDWLDGDALGLREKPNIETLLDALLDQDGNRSYYSSEADAAAFVLTDLINYSKDYYVMVDWEKRTCDFSGDLFARMMVVADKYGYPWADVMSGKADSSYRPPLTGSVHGRDIYEYETFEETKKQGRIPLMAEGGVPYETVDGGNLMAVNANSAHKEGAWEFICFMMSEEVQHSMKWTMRATNRAVCTEALKREVQWLEKGNIKSISNSWYNDIGEKMYTEERSWSREDVTDEKIEDYISMRERAMPSDTEESRRMAVVWQIIREEAEAYFTGSKSIEEVADLITNRVQLYMDEY